VVLLALVTAQAAPLAKGDTVVVGPPQGPEQQVQHLKTILDDITPEQEQALKAMWARSWALRKALEAKKNPSKEERLASYAEQRRIVQEGFKEILTEDQNRRYMAHLEEIKRRMNANRTPLKVE
jgi:hypothetical protein